MFFRLSSVLFFGLCAHTSVRVLKRQQNMLSVVKKRRRQAAVWQHENQIRPFCYRSQCWATAENSQTIIVFPWRQAYFAGKSGTNDDISAESCLKSFFPMRRRAGRVGEAARDSVVRHGVGFPVTSFSLSRVSESRSFQRHPPLFGSSFSSFPLYSFLLFPHVPSAPVHPPLLTARLSNHSFSVSRCHARQLHLLHFFDSSFFPPSVYCACNASAILGLQEASRSGGV